MVCKIKSSADEQYRAERKRFQNKQKSKSVIADKIEARNNKYFKEEQNKITEKRYASDY